MSDMVKVTPKNIVDEARDMPWKVAIEPFRVAPRVYYVGNVWVGSFLVDTEEGLAIIDTTVMEDLYLLLESIRKLGFACGGVSYGHPADRMGRWALPCGICPSGTRCPTGCRRRC